MDNNSLDDRQASMAEYVVIAAMICTAAAGVAAVHIRMVPLVVCLHA